MLSLADDASEMARIVGATNAIRRNPDGRWFADMFDGLGFANGLEGAGHRIEGRQALLVGAGGGGSAIAAALLQRNVGHLRIADIDEARVTAFVARLAQRWPDRVSVAAGPDPAGSDLVINASPMGLKASDAMPVDPGRLAPGTLVADIIMKPPETPLLKAAAQLGLPTHRGNPDVRQSDPAVCRVLRLRGFARQNRLARGRISLALGFAIHLDSPLGHPIEHYESE